MAPSVEWTWICIGRLCYKVLIFCKDIELIAKIYEKIPMLCVARDGSALRSWTSWRWCVILLDLPAVTEKIAGLQLRPTTPAPMQLPFALSRSQRHHAHKVWDHVQYNQCLAVQNGLHGQRICWFHVAMAGTTVPNSACSPGQRLIGGCQKLYCYQQHLEHMMHEIDVATATLIMQSASAVLRYRSLSKCGVLLCIYEGSNSFAPILGAPDLGNSHTPVD